MLNVEMSLSVNKLMNTDWAFGPTHNPGRRLPFRFGSAGRVEVYEHPNERGWSFDDGQLRILRENGEVMWEAKLLYVREGGLNLVLNSPFDQGIEEYTLQECGADGLPGYGGTDALSPARFLFPDDLQITPTPVSKILVVGSCLSVHYVSNFRLQNPGIVFDTIWFNNADILPDHPPSPVGEYDFQYLQMPLRTVITDRVIEASRLSSGEFVDAVLADGYAIIDQMLEAGLIYNKAHGLTVFVANFFVPQTNYVASMDRRGTKHDLSSIVRAFNDHLAHAVRRYPNVFLLDTEMVAASLGKRLFLDDILSFTTHGSVVLQEPHDMHEHARIEAVPHISRFYETRPLEFYRAIFEQALASYRTLRQVDQVKAVIFDLDHTLWRGQIAEDWRTGNEHRPHFAEWMIGLWDAVHQLRARGILVAICSKNDYDVVKEYWDNVVAPRFIGLEDFASVKINWLSKTENIREIIAEFNVKPKSVVFVDDNPVERESVRAAMPEIRCIGSNPYLTKRILLWSPETQIAHLTAETVGREEAIRGQIVREETRSALSRSDFLHTLKCQVTFQPVTNPAQPEFVRVLELTNKTNQFNTNGKRWTHAELQGFIAEGGEVFGFTVKDRFAEYGLMGALYVSGSSIVQMVMSCRVMGMEIEQCAIAQAVTRLRTRGDQADVFAELTETRDNGPCREIFTRAGFAELQQDGATHRYELSFGEPLAPTTHIEVIGERLMSLA